MPTGAPGPPSQASGAPEELVGHSLAYVPAFDTKDAWRSHIDGPAKKLEDYLGEASQHQCEICGKAMSRGAADHLSSQMHWKSLWQKMQRMAPRMPPPEVAVERARPWVQAFHVPGATLHFNHLTGGQHLDAAAAPAPPPQVASGPPPQPPLDAAMLSGAAAAATDTDRQVKELSAHASDYNRHLASKDLWRSFMSVPGKTLEDTLHSLSGNWDHDCGVCGKHMQRGAQDHLCSQNHWRMVWSKLESGGPLPPADAARRMDAPVWWVQRWEVGRATHIFNHLTGGQELHRSARPCSDASATLSQRARSPAGSSSQAAAVMTCSAPQFTDIRVTDPRLPVRGGVGYRDALNDKDNWKRFMEEPANRLERFIYAEIPTYHSRCVVCEAGMNGIANHILSQKHWKSLWGKLSGAPPPADRVVNWESRWVEVLQAAGGEYRFNHITGEQAWTRELSGPEAPAPRPAPSGPEGQAAAPCPRAPRPQALQGSGAPLAAPPAPAAARPSPLELWHWSCIVRPQAAKLSEAIGVISAEAEAPAQADGDPWDEATAGAAPAGHRCAICKVAFRDAREHLPSGEHLQRLRERLAEVLARDGDPPAGQGREWVQDFGHASFDHLTLEVTQ